MYHGDRIPRDELLRIRNRPSFDGMALLNLDERLTRPSSVCADSNDEKGSLRNKSLIRIVATQSRRIELVHATWC